MDQHLPTNIVATGAATSPYWLHNLSDTATVCLPILGALWLIIQGVFFLYDEFKKRKKPDVSKD